MNDTSFIFPAEKFDRLVGRSQRQNGGPLQEAPRTLPPKPAAFNGGGGLNSTAPDYIKFMQMILRYGRSGVRDEILTAKSVEAMSMNQIGDLGAKLKTFMPNLSSDVDVHPGFIDKWGLGFLINTTAVSRRPLGREAWPGRAFQYVLLDRSAARAVRRDHDAVPALRGKKRWDCWAISSAALRQHIAANKRELTQSELCFAVADLTGARTHR
jgi:CubicO group peptidase (beta-lactamase class C family)